jgi:FOG: Ankyrin repeat
MLAVLRGHDTVAQALLKAGAAVNHDGWAPLHYAAFEGREGMLDALFAAGADVNALAPNKATALMLAARNGHIGVVRRLLACRRSTSTRSTTPACPRTPSRCRTRTPTSPNSSPPSASAAACVRRR